MEEVAVLLNPSAGRGRAGREKDELEGLLLDHRIKFDVIRVSENEEDLRRMARWASENFEFIVGAGGDGTFDIIINELIKQGRGNTFGMIALGSCNDIVREFGVDSLERAISAIKSGKTAEVDLGVIKTPDSYLFYFLGTASLGLGTTVNRHVAEFRRNYGYLAWLGETILGIGAMYKSFASGEVPIPLQLTYGPSSFVGDFALVVFNNTSFYAGGINPNPSAKPNDGLLDCCCLETKSPLKTLYYYALAYLNRIKEGREILRLKSSEFKILSDGVEIQADGEILGKFREITLEVLPKVLRIIVSPDYVSK